MIAKFVFICLLTLGMHQSEADQPDLDFKVAAVPIFPPRIQFSDARGKPLTPVISPSLEFRDLKFSVPYQANTQDLWQPRTISDAASILRCMLPEDFYHRLKAGIDEFMANGEISDDPAVTERVGDVAKYLAELWDIDSKSWIGEESSVLDEFTFLSRILKNESNTSGVRGLRCD